MARGCYVPPFFIPRSFLLLVFRLILKLSCCFVPQLLFLRHLSYQLSIARQLAKPRPLPPSSREFMALGPLILPTFESGIVQYVVDNPSAVWFIGPLFAARTGLVFKEVLMKQANNKKKEDTDEAGK